MTGFLPVTNRLSSRSHDLYQTSEGIIKKAADMSSFQNEDNWKLSLTNLNIITN
jgi:hypothetical protein